MISAWRAPARWKRRSILRAVLAAGYLNALVTDEATAQRLIEG